MSSFWSAFDSAYQNAQQNKLQQREIARQDRQDKLAEQTRAEQADRNKKLFEAIGEARGGNLEKIELLDPELAMKYRTKFDEQAEKRRVNTANVMRQLQSAPDDERRAHMLDYVQRNSQGPNALFDPIDAPGPDLPPEQAARLGAQADAVLGPPKPEEGRQTTGDMKEAASVLGYGGDIGRAEMDPRWGRTLERLAKSRATQISVGKDLPTTAVQDLADADTALGVVDDIFSSFQQNVPSEGTVSQIGSRLEARVPNTGAAAYDNEADVATQVVGSFLEGGKLAEGDFNRYRKFFPRPGDSPTVAANKKAALTRMIQRRSEARRSALGGAGYRVPGAQPGKPSARDVARQAARGATGIADDVAASAPTADDLESLWGQ